MKADIVNCYPCAICGSHPKLWCNKTMVACSNKECANYRFSQTVKIWNQENGWHFGIQMIGRGMREKIEKTIMKESEMCKPYFADAQVGDRVTDIATEKTGFITDTDKDETYSIGVQFDDGSFDNYCPDGKYMVSDLIQRLYWHGATFSVTGDTPPVRDPELEKCSICDGEADIIDECLSIDGNGPYCVNCPDCGRNSGLFWSISSQKNYKNVYPFSRRAAINEWNKMNGE